MGAKEDALALVGALESSGRTGVWTNIRPKGVIDGLRIRIADPSKIDQAGSELCGPAAFVFDLATDDPVTYAKAVISLFTGGTAVIGTMLLRPTTDLLFAHFSGGIDPADWIIMASLRDSSNWLFDVEEVDDILGVATIPSTMVTWVQNAGYTKVINETNVWFTKDASNLRRASWLYGKHYRVFLFVNFKILETDKQMDVTLTPDHFVMLQSPVQLTGPPMESLQTVLFDVYSWGAKQTIPEDPKTPLSLPDFLAKYYGFIAFKH